MDRDEEEERLLRKKLLELNRRKLQEQRQAPAQPAPQPASRSPRQILSERLVDRGDEVLRAAEAQFPRETSMIVEKLAELIRGNQIAEPIRGGDLLALFRAVGLNVSFETSIRFEKDGRALSIADKLKEDKA